MSVSMIRRTSNPAEYRSVDAVIVDERRPPAGITGIGGIVAVVGEFEKGTVDEFTSIGNLIELESIFGGMGLEADGFYGGRLSMVGKQFGRLGVVRVGNSSQAVATTNFTDGSSNDLLSVTALHPGKYGNNIYVDIPASGPGIYTFRIFDGNNIVEIWEDVPVFTVGANPFIGSDWVVGNVIAAGVVDATEEMFLAGGSDGTFADSDYSRAIDVLKGPDASDVRWAYVAEYWSAAVNGNMLTLATTQEQVKRVLVSGDPTQSKSAAITDVGTLRSDKVGYAYPPVKVWIPEANLGKGGLWQVQPNSFAANILSRIAPGKNPAGPNGEPYLTAIREIMDKTLTLSDYELFRKEGIMGLQRTRERQSWSIRSGITTTLDPALKNWARRSMADWIQEGTAVWLTSFQNAPINKDLKVRIKSAIETFLDQQIVDGLLPSREDLAAFRRSTDPVLLPYEVDMVSGNTPEAEAQGVIVAIVRVRIYSTADFIVFRTEIGESVVITEQQSRTAA